MMVYQLVVGAGLICAATLIVRLICRRFPRYAPVSHINKHGQRIGRRSTSKSDCVWVPPNTK